MILGFLVKSFRRLWTGRDIWDETGDGALTAKKCGVRYFRDDFIRDVRKLTPARIPTIWRLLLEANTALKGGERSSRITLERMIIRMIASGSGRDGAGN